MEVQVLGFEVLKEVYNNDLDFGDVWKIVPTVLLIISWSKKVFNSKKTDCAYLNVLYEEQLFKKLME